MLTKPKYQNQNNNYYSPQNLIKHQKVKIHLRKTFYKLAGIFLD